MAILELDQSSETPLTEIHRGPFKLRYAYARSKECQEAGENGQDYLVWRVEPFRAVFALCDGVGQSFLGGIASQVVGEALIEWLWKIPPRNEPDISNPKKIEKALRDFLDSKRAKATQLVDEVEIDSVYGEFVRDALESRKNRRGTQSNFVCGIIDIPSEEFPEGRVLLFWLGDAKLQIWRQNTNETSKLRATWEKQEAWSSQVGVSGEIHFFGGTVNDVDCVIAHSDGVDPIRQSLSPKIIAEDLGKGLSQLGGDDVSFLEISMSTPSPLLEDDLVSRLRGDSQLPPIKIIVPTSANSPSPISVTGPTPEPKKRGKGLTIPFWFLPLGVGIIALFLVIAAGFGYFIGNYTLPPLEPTEVSMPTAIPLLPVVPPTPSPVPTEMPTLPIKILPTIAPTIMIPAEDGGYLINDGQVHKLTLNACLETRDGGGIVIRGPYWIVGYSSIGCRQGTEIIFLVKDSLPLWANVRSILLIQKGQFQ